jgi:Carboxypeptidase regulatory-like domain/TonB dependent receptor
MNRVLSLKMFSTIVVASLAIALLSVPAFGQTIDGSLTGTVYDPSGAAVNGATVTVINVATGQTVTAPTKTLGDYRFNDLPVGTYNLTVASPNFKTTTLNNIPVELNKIGTANVTLELGSSATTVEVSGVAPPVDTTSAQLQSTYDSSFSQDLGITSAGANGAGVLNLSLLSPGVTNSSAMGLGVGPSVGGQRPRDNNFTVEGVDNNNKSVTGALITVPNDAVENFTLLENQFNAEFGHSSGGQFNTTIKTGTNSFHGSLYEYFRNRNLNAVDNFYVLQGITTNPRSDSNRYGGTLGGPIVKNKLFFFTNFERQPVGATGTSGLIVLSPTAAGYAAIKTDPNLSANNFAIFSKYMPVAATGAGAANGGCIEYDTAARAGEAGQFGAYNAPANGTCPAKTIEVGDITFAAPAFSNYENFVQSVDYNMSEKDQIRGRYVFNKLDQIDTNASLPAFYLPLPFRWYLFTIGEYHTFTPSVLNEFRVGFNRYANTTPAGSFKYPGLDSFPNILLNDLGGVNIGPDPNAPQETIQNFYNGVDNVTWTKGAHTLKFGAEYRWYISPQTFTQRQRGDYEYNTAQSYLEDFSPDIIGERSQGASVYYGNQKGIYWYANDSWRYSTHLTLNLGVRWEYNSVPTGEQRQSLNSISSQPGIIVPGVNEPLLFSKIDSPKKNFAPRLGFAYSPGESGNTSIRGGFGLAYDVLYDNIGILAPPPQLGATNDVPDLNTGTANFLGGGGLNGGGSGLTTLSQATALQLTSAWIPPHTKWPYSINWNLGIQHSFGKDFTAEINYVGDRGVHLDVQDRINRQSLVNSTTFLPTYLQAPSQATLDALTNTVASIKAAAGPCGSFIPVYCNAGFGSNIVADLPLGSSSYNGLETQLRRRLSNGLAFQAAYTYSRTIDNATADFFSTSLTPRRQQDFQNFAAERSVSPLSRTHRFTIAAVYDLPYFKSGNWLMKNVVGNWGFSPIYTYESPEWADVQSGSDANLNGDSAGDRTVFNPAGKPGTGSAITSLKALSGPNTGQVVAYLATNPTAQYIKAGSGALATSSRNTLATQPTNDVDVALYKDLNITERFKFRLGAQFANILNHPQYIPGANPGSGLGVNDVNSFNTTTGGYLNYLKPDNVNFNNPKSVFASNARTIGIVGKLTF